MIQVFGRKNVLIASTVFMAIMFTIVMFLVNPLIDGKSGFDVIKLQLAFDKSLGLQIINTWGEKGTSYFKVWIFTDYIYALSYALFFSSLISNLVVKNRKENIKAYMWLISLAFFAGFLDCIENTMELFFVSNPTEFSNLLFFSHSLIALLKWTAMPVIFISIIFLMKKRSLKSD